MINSVLHFWGMLDWSWGSWSNTTLEDNWLMLTIWGWLFGSVHLLGSIWVSTFGGELVNTVTDWSSWWSSNGIDTGWIS
jgi:hypothetical protein